MSAISRNGRHEVRACLTFNLLTLYEIGSQSAWDAFCAEVNSGDTFSDKYVKLTADINVSTMAGSSETASFHGVFDGNGHTLSVNYNTNEAVTAPLRYVENAAIRNLKTTGTITTDAMCAAGIVGEVTGSLNLTNCCSSVAISSSRSDIDTHGGLVASNNGNVTISGCVFDGSFAATVAHTNQYGTTFCGGIVGMCVENTTTTITNSLVAPSSVSEGMVNKTFVGLYDGATVTIDNCYFIETDNLPTNQGTKVIVYPLYGEISKQITVISTTLYTNACTVSGVEAEYDLDEGSAFITPALTDPLGATLTLGTDFTATLNGNAVDHFPFVINTAGNYTLVLTGTGNYIGSKTFNITATGDPINGALLISSEEEWNAFAASVNSGTNYLGKYVKLTADVSVSTMVGASESNSFQGTFLGEGHTLTFTKGSSESAFGEENCAPFRFTNNATFRNLKVAGEIYTSRKFAAGLVARNAGTTTIEGCLVSTVIHSSVSGDGTHGGIVALPPGTLNIEGSVFEGHLLTNSGTNSCGGFVGWHNGATISVTNSLYAPDISIPEGWTAITGGTTFVRGGSPSITNCYYTETMGTAQGTQAYAYTTIPANLGDPVQDYGALQAYANGILYDGTYYGTLASITLANNADNSTTISEHDGYLADVTLAGRTLYKDGAWNTLCLPFDVDDFRGTPLEDATVMTLGNSAACNTGFDATTGTLTLDFVPANTIEAGVAYIVKWDKADDIVNPVFNGVTIENEALADHAVTSQDGSVQFLGTYAPVSFGAGGDNTVLYLGADNTLYYPSAAMTIGCQRAYFQLADGITAGDPTSPQQNSIRAFNLNFGDGDETTGIKTIDDLTIDNLQFEADGWFSLDGRKLDGKPTQRGIYINNGKKVVIK